MEVNNQSLCDDMDDEDEDGVSDDELRHAIASSAL
jgi:hypothetical protein